MLLNQRQPNRPDYHIDEIGHVGAQSLPAQYHHVLATVQEYLLMLSMLAPVKAGRHAPSQIFPVQCWRIADIECGTANNLLVTGAVRSYAALDPAQYRVLLLQSIKFKAHSSRHLARNAIFCTSTHLECNSCRGHFKYMGAILVANCPTEVTSVNLIKTNIQKRKKSLPKYSRDVSKSSMIVYVQELMELFLELQAWCCYLVLPLTIHQDVMLHDFPRILWSLNKRAN